MDPTSSAQKTSTSPEFTHNLVNFGGQSHVNEYVDDMIPEKDMNKAKKSSEFAKIDHKLYEI